MAESQWPQWLFSMPACSSINGAMQTLADLDYETSDQHNDATSARQARDNRNMRSILAYLQSRRPFERDSSLQNIVTRVIADRSVKAKEVRCKILESMCKETTSMNTPSRRKKWWSSWTVNRVQKLTESLSTLIYNCSYSACS